LGPISERRKRGGKEVWKAVEKKDRRGREIGGGKSQAGLSKKKLLTCNLPQIRKHGNM